MGAVYTDRIPESKRIGGFLNYCKNAGIITDALVNGNATITALKSAIDTAVVKTSQRPLVTEIKLALDRGLTIGVFSATHGVTTVAALVAPTDAGTTYTQNFLG